MKQLGYPEYKYTQRSKPRRPEVPSADERVARSGQPGTADHEHETEIVFLLVAWRMLLSDRTAVNGSS